MALIAFISIFITPYEPEQAGPPFIADTVEMFAFNVQDIGTLFSSTTFAMILHHSIPGIMQPVIPKE